MSDWDKAPGNEDQHYSGKIQPTDFAESKGLSFLEGNVIKYVTRHRKKAKKLDLQKSLWYIDRLIAKTDEKEFQGGFSTQDFIESQGFTELEAEIIIKFMMYYITHKTSDLYQVRTLVEELIEQEYGI